MSRAVRALNNDAVSGLPQECIAFFQFCGLTTIADAGCIVSVLQLIKKFEVFDENWVKEPLSALMMEDYYFDVVTLIECSDAGFDRRQLLRISDETVNAVYGRTFSFILKRINDYLEAIGETRLWNATVLCRYLGVSLSKHSEWKKEKADARKPRPYILKLLFLLLATPIWEIPILNED